jgi:bis(5'-nucleosyl)-tetraphosphatase (symmetrical)
MQAPAKTLVIGDVQGCFDELRALLAQAAFDPGRDRLILLGDLVNRGPQSRAVLDYVMALDPQRTVCLLGNHDLHLLAAAHGVRAPGRGDTLDAILQAPDRQRYLDWLRRQRLAWLHEDGQQTLLCVHAGVLPGWSTRRVLDLAGEVERALQSADYPAFLAQMYGNKPSRWRKDLQGADRLRVIVNALTRLRFCSDDGKMEFATKEGAGAAPPGYRPWFDVPGRKTADTRIAFGHWSTLGLRVDARLAALDTGCVWGGRLTALQLAGNGEPERLFQVGCSGFAAIGI